LKGDLKEWNISVFGNLEDNRRKIMKEIEKLDTKDANCDLLEGENMRRLELLSQQLESLNRQKARSIWFKYGDANTKYYHSLTRWRRLRNEIKGVEVDNQWCEEPGTV